MKTHNNYRLKNITLILTFAILLLAISALIAQQQYFSLMERQYCYEGGKWYTYSQCHIGDEILLHRIIVRLIDRDDMKSFDFAGYNIQGISVGSRRILSGFYLLKVVPDADPFKIATQLENTGLFDVIEFDALGQNLGTPNDPQYINQWNLKEDRLDMPHAWDISTGSSQVILAVIDGGVLYTHEDLDGNLWVNPAEDLNHNSWPDFFPFAQGGDLDGTDNDGNNYTDDLIGWDCFHDDNLPEADTHGTRVVGVAVAQTNNFENGQYRGVAGVAGGWGSQKGVNFMTLDDLDPTPIAPDAFAMAEAIQYATDNGADVINISGIFQYDYAIVREAVEYATSDPHNVVIVCAAGNLGDATMYWPARYSNTISVGATMQDDTRWYEDKKNGSQIGDEAHEIYLDVMAPGAPASIWTTESNGGYAQMGKTSAATPQVAGIAALMRSINSDIHWHEVRDILRTTADKVAGMGGNDYTDEYGFGRVDAYQALLLTLAYANKTPNISPTIYNNQRILARGQNSPATVLHEVFAAGVSESYEVFYRRSSNNGSSWDITTRLSPGTEKNLQPCIAVTDEGTPDGVHIVWQTKKANGKYKVYYRKSTDTGASWGDPFLLADEITCSINQSAGPMPVITSISYSGSYKLLVVWVSSTGLKYRTAYNDQWATIGSLDDSPYNDKVWFPSLMGKGSFASLTYDTRYYGVFSRIYNETSWSSRAKVNEGSSTCNDRGSQVAIRVSNSPMATWFAQRSGDARYRILFRSGNPDNTWSSWFVEFAPETGKDCYYPSLTDYSQSGQYRISIVYYTSAYEIKLQKWANSAWNNYTLNSNGRFSNISHESASILPKMIWTDQSGSPYQLVLSSQSLAKPQFDTRLINHRRAVV